MQTKAEFRKHMINWIAARGGDITRTAGFDTSVLSKNMKADARAWGYLVK